MSLSLSKSTILVLNRNWQAIACTTPAEVFGALLNDQARGLDIPGPDGATPLDWQAWCRLPIREGDDSIGTVHGRIRIPTVVVLRSFDRLPRLRLRFGLRGLWERDGGRCQYTGRELTLAEANIDHVIPSSKGGQTSWENCVLADRKVNTWKADRTPGEAGLTLLKKPTRPPVLPVTQYLKNNHQVKDWQIFLPAS